MKETLAQYWGYYDAHLTRYLGRHFPGVHYEHENIIGGAFEAIVRKASEIAEKYDGSIPLRSFLAAYLTAIAKNQGRTVRKRDCKRVQMADRSSLEEEGSEEGRAALPHIIAFGDQEEILWLKQLIERFGGLSAVDLARLRRIVDRADASEMLSECRELRELWASMRNGKPIEFARQCKSIRDRGE